MTPTYANAAPAKGGESGNQIGWTPFEYTASADVSSHELAAHLLSVRFGLPIHTGRLVARLSGLGGLE